MKKCPFCAEEIQDEAIVCRYCGRDLQTPPRPQAPPTPQAIPSVDQPDPADVPYDGGMAIGAGLLTFFAPFIALIVALVMRSNETRPKRRSFLQTWAIASGVWLATGWLIGLIVVASFAGAGGCRGGIDEFGLPTYTKSGASDHWTATYPCREGGSTTTPVPSPFADLPP